MIRVLFVCLGNICRSPMAEGIFARLIEDGQMQEKVACDSAGTAGYHTGELPDARMRKTALAHGIELTHRARTFGTADFSAFDYILVMDESNQANVLKLLKGRQSPGAQIRLMRDFDPESPGDEVPDPWFGEMEGFEVCYQILERSCLNLLEYLKKEHQL